jgi:hypothetical protein
MVIVRYARRADGFAASAAVKKKLQMNPIRHFYADLVLNSHLLSLFMKDSAFFASPVVRYHTPLTDAVTGGEFFKISLRGWKRSGFPEERPQRASGRRAQPFLDGLLAPAGLKDSQFLAVLGHGPPGNVDARGLQNLCDPVVAQRFSRVFGRDDFSDFFLDHGG